MPHATESDLVFSAHLVEEECKVPDASPQPLHYLRNESETPNARVSHCEDPLSGALRSDVRLEDLFNDEDDDEDEEFPSSRVSNVKVDSSPAAAQV